MNANPQTQRTELAPAQVRRILPLRRRGLAASFGRCYRSIRAQGSEREREQVGTRISVKSTYVRSEHLPTILMLAVRIQGGR